MIRKFALFSAICRHTFGKVLLLLGGLGAGNAVLFLLQRPDSPTAVGYRLDENAFFLLFAAVYLLLTFFLARAMCDRGGRQNWLLLRLRCSHGQIFLTHAAYNVLCYVLLFGVEVLSLLGLCVLSCRGAGPQTLLLICYRSDLLHSLFPLADILSWAALGLQVLSLGIATAAYSAGNRFGKTSILSFFLAAGPLVYLYGNRAGSALDPTLPICSILYCGMLAPICCFGAMTREVESDE